MQRSRQKRTMADIRSVATAWEARATDMNTYALAGITVPAWGDPTTSGLAGALSPTYIKQMPLNDAWGTEFSVGADEAAYVIASYGKDKSSDEATGTDITPGFVDPHSHSDFTVLTNPTAESTIRQGVTTMVELGTAGANTMLGFRMLAHQTRTRLYAFVHISSLGLAGHPHGESRERDDLHHRSPRPGGRGRVHGGGRVHLRQVAAGASRRRNHPRPRRAGRVHRVHAAGRTRG